MAHPIEPATLRILHPDGKTVGTGFLVASNLAVTCAHVVVAAEAIAGDTVQVQLTGRAGKLPALVEPAFWRDVALGDVAFLRLESVPSGVAPLPLGLAAQSQSGNPVYAFGYAIAAEKQGIGARGTIITLLPDASYLQIRVHEANHGMSGGPVWDEKRGVVVGMITQGHTGQGRNEETTFATPSELLFSICPELAPSETCPYLGLNAFREADARFFHGRKPVVARLLESLKREPRFLAVLGPSGSGKSSLVQAGLLPALRNGELIGADEWQFFQIRPGDDPFSRLDSAGLPGASQGLPAALGAWTQSQPEGHPVLVLDQFEELFTATPAPLREKFLAGLAELLASDLPVTLILTLRDDFYSAFARQAAALTPWLERGQVNLPVSLARDELREIITTPAALVGLGFEPGLVEALLDDVTNSQAEGPSVLLPLLEFALTQLWERRENGRLTHAAYQKLGGVTGGLAAWADRAYRAIPVEKRDLTQYIFTSLVNLGDEKTGQPHTRRRVSLANLVPQNATLTDVEEIVKLLADARLLVTHEGGVEITHEILLRSWPQLLRWLDENRASLQLHESVRMNAIEWDIHQRAETFLDHRGSRLDEALALGERLNQLDLLYLHACQALLEKQRRRDQRRNRLFWGSAVVAVLILMLVLAGWALSSTQYAVVLQTQVETAQAAVSTSQAAVSTAETSQQREQIAARNAIQSAEISRARELAARARILLPSNPHTSLLLSIESLRRYHTLEADTVLRELVTNTPQFLLRVGGTCLAYSPDSKRLVCQQANGVLEIWDLPERKKIQTLSAGQDIQSVEMSLDNQFLRVVNMDNSQAVWDIQRRVVVATSAPGEQLILSPDGKTLAWLNSAGQVSLRKLDQPAFTSLMGPAPVTIYQFSPDGQRLFTVAGGTLSVWDAAGQPVAQLVSPLPIRVARFARSGKTILAGDEADSVWEWDFAANQTVQWQTLNERIRTLAVSDAGGFYAAITQSNRLVVWSADNTIIQLEASNELTDAISFASGKDTLVVAQAGFLRIYTLPNAVMISEYYNPQGADKIVVSPDGSKAANIYAGEVPDEITGVDIQDTVDKTIFQVMQPGVVRLFSPDSQTLVLRHEQLDSSWIFDFSPSLQEPGAASQAENGLLPLGEGEVNCQPGDRQVSVRYGDGKVFTMAYPDNFSANCPLVFQARSRDWLALGWLDTVTIVDLLTGQPRELSFSKGGGLVPIEQIQSMYLTPNQTRLIAGGGDLAMVWDTQTWQPVQALSLGENLGIFGLTVKQVALNRTGSHAIITQIAGPNVAPENTAIYDVATGAKLAGIMFPSLEMAVFSGPNDEWISIIPATENPAHYFWQPQDLIAQACKHALRNFSRQEWATYLGGIPYQATCPNLPLEPEITVTMTPEN